VDVAVVLILILVVALIWRGPRTLPQIGAMLGRGVRQVRREIGTGKPDGTDRDEQA
jgi:Sec-independent protein translocase protein TatA